MNRCLRYGLVAIPTIAYLAFPFAALSNPEWIKNQWHFVPNTPLSQLSQDPGGLVAYFNSDLNLRPSSIAYAYVDGRGSLSINHHGERYTIDIEPEVVAEIIEVVESNDSSRFEVSIGDSTAVGTFDYVSEEIRNSSIGELFLKADEDFGYRMLSGGYDSFQEIDYHVETRSKVSLHFSPETSGYVALEFEPHFSFYGEEGFAVDVEGDTDNLAKREYIALQGDVKERPLAYREDIPSLDKAAQVVAALGFLEAACKEPGSCQELEQRVSAIAEELQEQKQKLEDSTTQVLASETSSDLVEQSNFSPEDTPEGWSRAYELVEQIVRGETYTSEELRNIVSKQFLNYPVPESALLQASLAVVQAWKGNLSLSTVAQQKALELSADDAFERIEVLELNQDAIGYLEDNSLNLIYERIQEQVDERLNALYETDRQEYESLYEATYEEYESLYEATYEDWDTTISRDYPNLDALSGHFEIQDSDRREAQRLQGIFQELSEKNLSLKDEAYREAYQDVESYLLSCLTERADCSLNELRAWEAKVNKAGMVEDEMSNTSLDLDLAWIHGLLSYLIGTNIDDHEQQLNRKRFLYHYEQKAYGEHRTRLEELRKNWENELSNYGVRGTDTQSTTSVAPIIGFTIVSAGLLSAAVMLRKHKRKEILEGSVYEVK